MLPSADYAVSRSEQNRGSPPAPIAGGTRTAAMYSLIVTAKLNDIDPQAWLADVLARIAEHPASLLNELLPYGLPVMRRSTGARSSKSGTMQLVWRSEASALHSRASRKLIRRWPTSRATTH